MFQYTIEDCWSIVRRFLGKFTTQRFRVKCLILYNSMVRGDFIDGRSDIDIMAVVDDDAEAHKLKEFYAEFCSRNNCGDEPEYEKAKDIIPFQLFIYTVKQLCKMDYGIYYHDFMNNHIVLYGEDLTNLIKKSNPKRAAKTFISKAVKTSESWDNPPEEVMKRHLKWMKFYPAYLAIETMKATLLFHGITDFNKNRLVENLKKIANFKEENLARQTLQIYLKDETRKMDFASLRQTYKQIHHLIQHLQQLCCSK